MKSLIKLITLAALIAFIGNGTVLRACQNQKKEVVVFCPSHKKLKPLFEQLVTGEDPVYLDPTNPKKPTSLMQLCKERGLSLKASFIENPLDENATNQKRNPDIILAISQPWGQVRLDIPNTDQIKTLHEAYPNASMGAIQSIASCNHTEPFLGTFNDQNIPPFSATDYYARFTNPSLLMSNQLKVFSGMVKNQSGQTVPCSNYKTWEFLSTMFVRDLTTQNFSTDIIEEPEDPKPVTPAPKKPSLWASILKTATPHRLKIFTACGIGLGLSIFAILAKTNWGKTLWRSIY